MKIFLAATNNGMTRAQRAEVIAKYPPKYILETMIISQYVVKFCMALLDTPFFYCFTKQKK